MSDIRTIKGVPGGFMIDGQAKVFVETYEGWKYDTVAVENAGAAIASGQQFFFFRDLTNKNLIDTNVTQQRRISRGEEMEIKTIGAYVSGRAPNNTEISALNFKWALERLYLEVKINKKAVIEGPLQVFPAGIGAAGYSSETTTAVLSNGVPSLAALRPLYKSIDINSDHDIEGIMTHFAAAWLTYTAPSIATAAAICVRLFLGGKVKAGVTRG